VPLVSVIIPAYNAEKHLSAAIDSVVAQNWGDLEIIVVDDGSSDDSYGVASSYDDSRIQIIRQKNRGAAAARNRGFLASAGEYIQYLDADDRLGSGKLRNQLSSPTSGSNTEILTGHWQPFRNDPGDMGSTREPDWLGDSPLEWLKYSLTGGGMYQTACWLTPRNLIEAAGPWDESLSLHDDGEFFCRVLLKADKVRVEKRSLVHYRIVDGSLSRQRNPAAAISSLKVSESRELHLRRHEDSKRIREACATSYFQIAYEFGISYPDISEKALNHIDKLNSQPFPTVGGTSFRALTRLFGARSALRIRGLLGNLR